MSKAFTKEGDSEEEVEAPEPLPPNLKNYMTPQSFEALQAELRFLQREERPKIVDIVSWAAGNGDRSENGDYIYGKKRLREIDRRLRYLIKRIETAEVVNPQQQQGLEQVFFGATVGYCDGEGKEYCVQIVGVDEADAGQGKISWVSPLARTLLKARVGDALEHRAPGGSVSIEILSIRYVVAAKPDA